MDAEKKLSTDFLERIERIIPARAGHNPLSKSVDSSIKEDTCGSTIAATWWFTRRRIRDRT
jgi:hypothetical protein